MATSDLLLTGATMFYAPVGTAVPDANAIAVGDPWGGSWVSMGALASVSLVEETTIVDRKGGKQAPVARNRTKQVFGFKSALQELNAQNIALVKGYNPATDGSGTVTQTAAGASQIGMDRFQPGANSSCSIKIPEWAVGIEGILCTADDNLGFVRVFITKGSFMADGDEVWDIESEGVVMPFAFNGLYDAANPGGQHYFRDIMTAVATS